MQTFIKTAAYTATLLLCHAGSLQAQKIKEYYPDGKPSFKGNYTYIWSEAESYEYPQMEAERSALWSNRFNELDQYANIIPRKQYDGKCTFYYINGQVYYTGTYKNGAKEGTFTFYHLNGKLAARRYYDRGMATGTWESWDEQGRMTTQFHYTPFSPEVMREINNMIYAEASGSRTRGGKTYVDSIFSGIYEQSWRRKIDTRTGQEDELVQTISKYAEKSLFKRSMKDGSFKIWKEGKPYLEFYFKQNKPVGIWKMWEDDVLMAELNLDVPRPPKEKRPEPVIREVRLGDPNGSDDPMAIDPGIVAAPSAPEPENEKKNFTFVEQMPEFPGGQAKMMEYLSKNIHYPQEAIKNGVSGKVFVRFIVTEAGNIEDVEVVRRVNPLLDREAVRVVKSMPKWKPGKQNGKAVRVYYNLPVQFALQ